MGFNDGPTRTAAGVGGRQRSRAGPTSHATTQTKATTRTRARRLRLPLLMLPHMLRQRLGTTGLRAANGIERKLDVGLLGSRFLRHARRRRSSCSRQRRELEGGPWHRLGTIARRPQARGPRPRLRGRGLWRLDFRRLATRCHASRGDIVLTLERPSRPRGDGHHRLWNRWSSRRSAGRSGRRGAFRRP